MVHTQHIQDKKSMLGQGIIIFVYLGILTVIEFLVAVAFDAVPLLVVFALVKAALVIYYYMHIYKLSGELETEGERESYEYQNVTDQLGLWLFLISDSFVYGCLMIMRINLLGLGRPALNQF